ncbi:GAP family protein [Streptomyces bungoensis]
MVIGEVTPFALGIALSPFPVAPAIFLLFTPRPRAAGGAFLAGWVAGILVVVSLLALLAGVVETREETPAWVRWAKAVLGAILILVAVRQWRPGSAKEGTPAWMSTLTEATPAKALRLGLLLSAANPKVVLLSAGAGLTIGSAELGPPLAFAALAVFTVISACTVALPLLLYLAAGERVLAPLGKAKTWLETHNSSVTALILTVIGALLVIEGATAL